jgi:hypothetical protein
MLVHNHTLQKLRNDLISNEIIIKLALAFILVIAVLFHSMAQDPASTKRDYITNNMFWGNLTIAGKIKGKFSYALELEERRQADPEHAGNPKQTVGSDHNNIFKNNYQRVFRPWVHYQITPKYRLSYNPFTWFGTWAYPVNGKTSFQPEFRTSVQVTSEDRIGRIRIIQRYRFEYRWYGTKANIDDDDIFFGSPTTYDFVAANEQMRFRYLFRTITPINNKELVKGTYYALVSTELFLKFGHYIPNYQIYDQNRTYIGIGYKLSEAVRFEGGYMLQNKMSLTNTAQNEVDLNSVLFVNVLIDDFNSFFKKKKQD